MWKYNAILSALFAALTAIFAKVGLKDINSDIATAIRVSFILFLVWGMALHGGAVRQIVVIPGKTWLFLLLSAIATGLSWLFYFRALQDGDASKVAPIDKMSVPLTILLSIIFLGERLTWQIALGGALITIGSLVLLV